MPRIIERTLRQWRKEALLENAHMESFAPSAMEERVFTRHRVRKLNDRVASLTQELLDQHLISKEGGNKVERPKYFDEICSRCGKTFGTHHGGSSPWPYGYCPDPDCSMDWKNGPGTIFFPSGKYAAEEEGKENHP